jgi:ubiquinone/menaquinone biosynthesis C-methylase UbiE
MKTLEKLIKISDQFFERCQNILHTHPWAVCIAMHEYARNLYPADPYIPFPSGLCHTERLHSVASNLIEYFDQIETLAHYQSFPEFDNDLGEVKEKTGDVYGRFWEQFSYEDLTNNAVKILTERWVPNGFSLEYLKGKTAIDIGCGSGRYTFALAELGCRNVIGIDHGERGLAVARKIVKHTNVENISFQKADVLDIPFEDESFDFVFCHGVLHHTEDMEQGLSEMVRVAKTGSTIWLYIYGDGGVFWYARKKMPQVMKQIPQHYTMKVLNILGMPSNRFIFADNWYVPLERHTSDQEARNILRGLGIKKIKRKEKGRPTDLDFLSINGGQVGKIMWGDGELSYFLEK